MQKNDYPKLRECPFCGGEAMIRTSVSLLMPKRATAMCYCKKCNANGKLFEDNNHDGTFIYEAIEAWNRRVDAE